MSEMTTPNAQFSIARPSQAATDVRVRIERRKTFLESPLARFVVNRIIDAPAVKLTRDRIRSLFALKAGAIALSCISAYQNMGADVTVDTSAAPSTIAKQLAVSGIAMTAFAAWQAWGWFLLIDETWGCRRELENAGVEVRTRSKTATGIRFGLAAGGVLFSQARFYVRTLEITGRHWSSLLIRIGGVALPIVSTNYLLRQLTSELTFMRNASRWNLRVKLEAVRTRLIKGVDRGAKYSAVLPRQKHKEAHPTLYPGFSPPRIPNRIESVTGELLCLNDQLVNHKKCFVSPAFSQLREAFITASYLPTICLLWLIGSISKDAFDTDSGALKMLMGIYSSMAMLWATFTLTRRGARTLFNRTVGWMLKYPPIPTFAERFFPKWTKRTYLFSLGLAGCSYRVIQKDVEKYYEGDFDQLFAIACIYSMALILAQSIEEQKENMAHLYAVRNRSSNFAFQQIRQSTIVAAYREKMYRLRDVIKTMHSTQLAHFIRYGVPEKKRAGLIGNILTEQELQEFTDNNPLPRAPTREGLGDALLDEVSNWDSQSMVSVN